MEVKAVKVKLLGRGSYGVVHLMRTLAPVPDEFYAVKSAPETMSDSLKKEQQILKHFVGSPHIIQCFGGFTSFQRDQGDTYHLFLEYAPGGSLLDLMRDYGGKIPEKYVMFYAQMILEGLVDIHQKGYIHSDLKPENILVFPTEDGGLPTLKIADFGLVKKYMMEDESVWEYGFRGTPDYMSPESVLGEVSGALDVWSLGCIIVQLVTGRFPWAYRDMKHLRDKLLRGESPHIPENMSATGKNFLEKCFARNPDQRWTAEMLLSHPSMPQNHTLLPLTFPQSLCNLSPSLSSFQEKKLLRSPPGFSRSRCNLAIKQSPPGFSRSRNNIASLETRKFVEEMNTRIQLEQIDRRLQELFV
ncbi:hypothetical protein PTKIN_Ptkin10aG0158600 [Pterospermum kingtungense]